MRLTWRLGIAAMVLAACSSQEAGDGSWRPLPTPSGPVDDSRHCVRAQRTEARAAAYELQRVVLRVLRDEQPRTENTVRLRRLVDGAEEAVERRCEGRTALDPVVDVVETRVGDARGALDEPALRVVVEVFRDWIREVGARSVIYYRSDPCELYERRVDLSVDVARSSTPGGTVARVFLVVENRLAEGIILSHDGTVRVTGLAPDGHRKRLWWGGSSADSAAAGAGRTTRSPIWPVPLPDVDIPIVPIVPGASLDFRDVGAWVSGQVGCRMQVAVPAPG